MTDELLPVTQGHREAAAALWRKVGDKDCRDWQADWMQDGTADAGPVVQAFARSRTITKEQVEQCRRDLMIRGLQVERDVLVSELTDSEWMALALAAAKAFGLTIEDANKP